MEGRIHSFQSFGAVDGPGLRFVVFMQGCALRCAYCHNPDTWDLAGGEEYTARAVVEKVMRYQAYFGENGGVTVSGGEPLLQWEFVAELFALLQDAGIQTALDTAGFGSPAGARAVLEHTDLVLCDLKFSQEEEYLRHTGGSLTTVRSFLKQTEKMGIPLWIRHVVVPGLTDGNEQVLKIAELSRRFVNLQRIELLPFRKLCVTKYDELNIPFPLLDYPECPDSEIRRLSALIDC